GNKRLKIDFMLVPESKRKRKSATDISDIRSAARRSGRFGAHRAPLQPKHGTLGGRSSATPRRRKGSQSSPLQVRMTSGLALLSQAALRLDRVSPYHYALPNN